MNPYARHKARFCAIQAIYQWQLAKPDLAILLQQFLPPNPAEAKKIDQEYFDKLVTHVVMQNETLDNVLAPHLDRALKEVSQVECAILRVSTCELKFFLDTPYRVVINEALELAKVFGGKNSFKYINGVLDRVARELRPTEFSVAGDLDVK